MLLKMALFILFYGWVIFPCVYIHHILSQLSVDRHLGCFYVLAIVNNAARNIGVHVSFWISVFIFSGYIPKSGLAGSYGSSIFSFLRNFLWSGHSRWLFSCSQYTPCPTSACFSYILLTWLTFLRTCPRPQLVIVLIKGAVRGVPLCWFLW